MKKTFTSQKISIAVGTVLTLVGIWLTSRADEAATGFFVVACCTAVAAGAFLIWAIKSFLGWRQSRT